MSKLQVEQPYESYRVLDLKRSSHLSEFIALVEGEDPTFAAQALRDMISSGDCRSVVVESGYIDRDHSRSFTAFYAQAFQEIPQEGEKGCFFTGDSQHIGGPGIF